MTADYTNKARLSDVSGVSTLPFIQKVCKKRKLLGVSPSETRSLPGTSIILKFMEVCSLEVSDNMETCILIKHRNYK